MNVRRSIAKATVVIAAAALSLGLSSCGRGFDNPTDQVYNPAVGVNDQDSDVDVLNAVIVSGSDGSGTLVATLVNNDQENDDTLTGISAGGDDQAEVTPPGETSIDAGSLLSLADEGGAQVEGEAVEGRLVRHADVHASSAPSPSPSTSRSSSTARAPTRTSPSPDPRWSTGGRGVSGANVSRPRR